MRSPNVWSLGDTALVQDHRSPELIPVTIRGFTPSLVRLQYPDGAQRLRPYTALRREPDGTGY